MLPEVIKAIIFDLDGTLLEGKGRHYQCYADILTRHGYQPMSRDEYWAMKRSGLDRRSQLARSDAASLYETFLKEWLENIEHEHYLQLDTLQDGALGKLSQLHGEGLALYLVTMRQNQSGLFTQLDVLGIRNFFSQIFVSRHSEGGVGKAKHFVDLSLDPSKCLWIGDSEADIDAARFMGCKIWAVSSGIRSESYLASLKPDFLSSSLIDQIEIPSLGPVA